MRRNIRSVAVRIGSLGSSTTAVALSSVVALPVLISQLGLSVWGNLAFAQSLGLMIATFANWGYQSFGQKQVAAKPRDIQVKVLFEATQVRVLLVALLYSGCCVFLFVFKQANFLALVACAGGYLISGLSNMWYFQGTDTTSRAVWLEAIPKIAAMWLAIGSLFISQSFEVFGIVFLIFSVLSSIISLSYLLGLSTALRAARTCLKAWSTIKRTWMGASASAASLVYMAFPTVLIGVIAPSALATYALLDRLIRFASLGLSPITASLQSWVLIDRAGSKIETTIRKSGLITLVYASTVGIGFTFSMNLASLIFADFTKIIPAPLVILAAATISASVSTQVLGPAFLGSQQNLKYQFAAASAGALAWIAIGPLGIIYFSGLGAQSALALAEFTVLFVQAIRVASIRRNALGGRGLDLE